MVELTLYGKPVSTNHYKNPVCRGRFPSVYVTAEAKVMKEDYAFQAKDQYKGKPLTENLSVSVHFYHKDKRKHDIDNYFKLLFDSLTGIIWEDDGQITELHAQKFIDKENPRIEVVIK